jgi:succinoglycan biosynthesis transport protein ExoP
MDLYMQPGPAALTPNAAPERGAGWQVRGADMLALLRRNAWLLAGSALAGAALAYVYASTLPKSYTADSMIAVEGDRIDIPELQGVLRSDGTPDPMPLVHTEAQALGARQLIAGLVNELHLDRDPEFNAALRPPTVFARATGWVKSLLPHPAASHGAPVEDDSVVNAVSHALAISQDNRSLVIGASFTAHDPRLAATVVNRLVADYVDERHRRRASADQGANTALTQRIDQVRADIENIENRMQQLRQSSGIVALRAGSIGQQQVEDLTNEAEQAAAQRSTLEANLARAQAAAASGSSEELAAVLGSETVSRLREQESTASSRVADLSARFGANYPELQSARADLSSVHRQLGGEAHRIVASLSTQLKIAQAHEADIDAQLARARTAGAASQDVQAQLEQMRQDVAMRRTLYSTLLERAQQTVAAPAGAALPDVRVLSVASPPGLPSAPKMKLAAGLGGLAGALCAGLVAFVRGSARTQFGDDSEIVAATGAAILARLRGRPGRWERLPAAVSQDGTQTAALRSGLAQLRRAGNGYTPRVIALAGTQAGRQAFAVTAALARLAASEGQSVLLIETEAGTSDFSRLLGASPAPSDITAEDGWRAALTHDAASPVELLSGFFSQTENIQRNVALENVLVEAREEYDLILLGAPEAGGAAASGLARIGDLLVFVVDKTVASPEAVRADCTRLRPLTRARPGAIVLEAA